MSPIDLSTAGGGRPPEVLEGGGGQPCVVWVNSSRHADLGRFHRIEKEETVIGRGDEADDQHGQPAAVGGKAHSGTIASHRCRKRGDLAPSIHRDQHSVGIRRHRARKPGYLLHRGRQLPQLPGEALGDFPPG